MRFWYKERRHAAALNSPPFVYNQTKHSLLPLALQDLSYKERHWHSECFLCVTCSRSLVDRPFASKDDMLMCTECYSNKYSAKCNMCLNTIMPGEERSRAQRELVRVGKHGENHLLMWEPSHQALKRWSTRATVGTRPASPATAASSQSEPGASSRRTPATTACPATRSCSLCSASTARRYRAGSLWFTLSPLTWSSGCIYVSQPTPEGQRNKKKSWIHALERCIFKGAALQQQ